MKTASKLALFVLLTGLPLTIYFIFSPGNPLKRRIPADFSGFADSSIFFLGSSRVQLGVDTTVLRDSTHNRNIYNLGISAGTFLSNCIVATRIMKSRQPKTLVIELSAMLPDVPADAFESRHNMQLEIYNVANTYLQGRDLRQQALMMEQLTNKYLTGKAFLYEQILGTLTATSTQTATGSGFQPMSGGHVRGTSSMLSWSDFSVYFDAEAVAEYAGYFAELSKQAAQSNTKILYLLPLTFGSANERQTSVPVYNSIGNHEKVVIAEDFLQSIRNEKYLWNRNHLNAAGAKIYSAWLAQQLVTPHRD